MSMDFKKSNRGIGNLMEDYKDNDDDEENSDSLNGRLKKRNCTQRNKKG